MGDGEVTGTGEVFCFRIPWWVLSDSDFAALDATQKEEPMAPNGDGESSNVK